MHPLRATSLSGSPACCTPVRTVVQEPELIFFVWPQSVSSIFLQSRHDKHTSDYENSWTSSFCRCHCRDDALGVEGDRNDRCLIACHGAAPDSRSECGCDDARRCSNVQSSSPKPADRTEMKPSMNPRIVIRGICSMATRVLLDELAATWSQRANVSVSFQAMGGVDALQQVLAGMHYDLVVLASNAIEALVAAGKVDGCSRIDFVRSGVGVAVPTGAVRPVIDTQDALRDTVLRAPSIGYSTGPSGVALLALFERWNVLDQIRGQLVQARPGVPVGAMVARGEVALGFQQDSELMGIEGIQLLGPMPPGTEIITIFSAALATGCNHPAEAGAFLEFMNSNDSNRAKKRCGFHPL